MKSLFEIDSVCRLCLKLDAKVYKLDNTHHKAFIEAIIALKIIKYIPTADYNVCGICRVLLTKSFNFIQAVEKAQEIVFELLKNNDRITEPMLKNIDRQKYGLDTVTLTSFVVICESKLIYDTKNCSDTKLNINEIEKKAKEDGLSPNCEKSRQPKQEQDQERFLSNTCDIYCISDEEPKEPIACNNIDVIEISDQDNANKENGDPIEINNKISKRQKYIYTDVSSDSDTFEEYTQPKRKSNRKTVTKSSKSNISKNKENGDPIEINNKRLNQHKSKNMKTVPNSSKSNISENKENGNPIEINNKRSNQKPQKYFYTDVSSDSDTLREDTQPKHKSKNMKTVTNSPKSNISKNRKKKESDVEYRPDSTSHSEDSLWDSYDDEGKPIKRPKHNRVYPMKCDHCDYEVPMARVHYRHYLCAHPNIEYPYPNEKVPCSICGNLVSKQKIESHERAHTDQKVKCELCPRIYRNVILMRRHMLRVHPKHTFTCDYCSKVFKTRVDIGRHIRIHTGSKPYKCHICEAAFAHSGNRAHHIRSTHQNIRYVPKKHNNQDSSDTEDTVSSYRKTKGKRKNTKNKNVSVKVLGPTKKKRKCSKQRPENKKADSSDTVSQEGNLKRKRKKKSKYLKTDMNNDKQSLNSKNNNQKNTETESDDEVLSEIKKYLAQ